MTSEYGVVPYSRYSTTHRYGSNRVLASAGVSWARRNSRRRRENSSPRLCATRACSVSSSSRCQRVAVRAHQVADLVGNLAGLVDVAPEVSQASLRQQDRHVGWSAVRLQAVQDGRGRVEVALLDGGLPHPGAQQRAFRFGVRPPVPPGMRRSWTGPRRPKAGWHATPAAGPVGGARVITHRVDECQRVAVGTDCGFGLDGLHDVRHGLRQLSGRDQMVRYPGRRSADGPQPSGGLVMEPTLLRRRDVVEQRISDQGVPEPEARSGMHDHEAASAASSAA